MFETFGKEGKALEEAGERFLTPRRVATLAIVPGRLSEIKRRREKIFQNVGVLSQNAGNDGAWARRGFGDWFFRENWR
ncbi:MAG: hypothetical protein IJ387_08070 [Thermoguttaceae bacterium]|nr:hypothetical protein [Thermoguttaceae bacterium]